ERPRRVGRRRPLAVVADPRLDGRVRRRMIPPQQPVHPLEDLVERLAGDVLHHVVMRPPAPDRRRRPAPCWYGAASPPTAPRARTAGLAAASAPHGPGPSTPRG